MHYVVVGKGVRGLPCHQHRVERLAKPVAFHLGLYEDSYNKYNRFSIVQATKIELSRVNRNRAEQAEQGMALAIEIDKEVCQAMVQFVLRRYDTIIIQVIYVTIHHQVHYTTCTKYY